MKSSTVRTLLYLEALCCSPHRGSAWLLLRMKTCLCRICTFFSRLGDCSLSGTYNNRIGLFLYWLQQAFPTSVLCFHDWGLEDFVLPSGWSQPWSSQPVSVTYTISFTTFFNWSSHLTPFNPDQLMHSLYHRSVTERCSFLFSVPSTKVNKLWTVCNRHPPHG